MKKKLIILLIVAGTGFLVYRNFFVVGPAKSGAVKVSGNIEVTQAELSFKIPGLVIERRVTEGEMVTKEQIVALLDSEEYKRQVEVYSAQVHNAEAGLAELLAGSRPEEIEQAKAAADRAKSYLDQLLAGARPQEILAAEAVVANAKAEMINARVAYDRQKRLLADGIATQDQYDLAEARNDKAAADYNGALEKYKLVKEGPRAEEIDQARAAWKEAERKYTLVKIGPRKEDIAMGRARLEEAKSNLALAQTRLGYTTLNAPMTAMVLAKNIEPGEFVAAGTAIITAGDLQDIWLRTYINETDLGRVKLGQKARVTTDTYPGRIYDGRVTFISSQAEFTPKNVQTEKERVKLVYRIKITLANPRMELKPGMPADAEILTGKDK